MILGRKVVRYLRFRCWMVVKARLMILILDSPQRYCIMNMPKIEVRGALIPVHCKSANYSHFHINGYQWAHMTFFMVQ